MSDLLKRAFDDLVILRNKNIALINTIDDNKLLTIPDGLNNNIYWQAGHILTVQASLLYKRTAQPLPIDKTYLNYFGKGTSPKGFDDNIPTIEILLEQLKSSLLHTESNYIENASLPYDETITVSTDHQLSTFADALLFLPLHEAYHFGSMSAMKKLLES